MPNTINENITKRILHEQLMKLVCEDETPVATESNGTYIYCTLYYGNVDIGECGSFKAIIHTTQDFNNSNTFNDVMGEHCRNIINVDFVFDIDNLLIRNETSINGYQLSSIVIIPSKIGDTLMPDIKKNGEDTIRRKKISNILKTTCEKIGRKLSRN